MILIDFHGFSCIAFDFFDFHKVLDQGAGRPVAACGGLWRASPALMYHFLQESKPGSFNLASLV